MPFVLVALPEQPAIDNLGVALRGSVEQRHVGLLYRHTDGSVRLSHLAGHLRFADEAYPGAYFCSPTAMDVPNQRHMAAWLEALPAAVNQFKYGINSDGVHFKAGTQELLPGPIGRGLTCATFVMAVMSHNGFEVIDKSTWKIRPDDEAWQKKIIEVVRAAPADAQHIEAMKADVGASRYRPEEVAASTETAPPPSTMEEAEEAARAILELMGLRARAD